MKVGIQARLKNGILWEAAKKIGSQSALARHLGISAAELGRWINFQGSAIGVRTNRPPEFWQEVEIKLLELTGHSLEEIFPPEIRTEAFLKRQKKIDAIVEMPIEQLMAAGAMPQLAPAPDDLLFKDDVRATIDRVLSTLKPREARVINLRFGLNGNEEHTLEDVAELEHVTRERVRQIEARALGKLRTGKRRRRLKSYAECSGEGITMGDYHPEPHKFPRETSR